MHLTMPQGKHVQIPDSPDPRLMMEECLHNQVTELKQGQMHGTKGEQNKQFFLLILNWIKTNRHIQEGDKESILMNGMVRPSPNLLQTGN